ncbi:MAG: IclR family transcriptional regulator C-terminal domain-containing protein [Steroidobacteraceae bacterium]
MVSQPKTVAQQADQMGGFAKGLLVIEAFSRGAEALTLADIARLAGLDRATARRCVLTLVNAGYATLENRLVRLTPRILRLSQAYLAAPLPRFLQPALESLADELQESCSGSVLDGTKIVYVARAGQHRIMSVRLMTGSRLPAYCTSMGRALLAWLPAEQARDILLASERQELTKRTITDVDALMSKLEEVRRLGYALVDQEVEIGMRSLAVPVRTTTGKVIASINVGTPTSRGSLDRLRSEFLPRLLHTQARLAEILP